MIAKYLFYYSYANFGQKKKLKKFYSFIFACVNALLAVRCQVVGVKWGNVGRVNDCVYYYYYLVFTTHSIFQKRNKLNRDLC